MVKKRPWIPFGIGLVMAGAIASGQNHVKADEHVSRQAMIHERGSLVMPFDLKKTVHVFRTTKDGGIQQVRARDPGDVEQIHLIQQHLTGEAERFARGDFSDPGALHGEDMPGLQVLERSGGALTVSYRDLPDGAALAYTTRDPKVLKGIHQWFAAQLHDHGADARIR